MIDVTHFLKLFLMMRKLGTCIWPLALMSCPQIRNENDADHHARLHPMESNIIQLKNNK
jgi:hypothetical protein